MNIAIFASAFYPSLGGVEELVRQLAQEFRRRGLKPYIVTNRWPRDLPEHEEIDGLPVYRFAMRSPEGSLKARVSYEATHKGIVRDIVALVRERQTDILHIECIGFNAYYALEAKRALGLPLVATAQGEVTMDVNQIYQTSPFMNRVLQNLKQEADVFTGCSQKTLDDLRDHIGGFPRDNGRAIFNGARLDDFEKGAPFEYSKPYVLAIGRMVKQKGFDTLLHAFALALQKNDMAGHDLILAGAGDEREPLEALARELKLGERVVFPGRADHEMAVSLFKGCSFFVLPSRADEGLPVVSVEAMAAGKAIVATRVGGVPESVLDGETGLLVPRDDANALAEKMALMAGDPEMRERMAQAGAKRVSLFEWSTIADQYLEAYRAAIKTK